MPRTIFVCSYENCSSTFRHRERYENHLRLHSGERPFICLYDDCDKSYRRLSHLKKHESTHASPLNCSFSGCTLILSSKDALKKHVLKCHSEKQSKKYKCETCSEEFNKHTTLQIHLAIHTGIKPFPCTVSDCDKRFLMPCKLRQHMKCHKGYTCDESNCGQLFQKWSLLRTHKKLCHPKTFKCQVCGKEFANKCNLKGHSVVHKDEIEIFNCPILKCIRFYQSKRSLTDHLKDFHEKRTLSCSYENCHRFFFNEGEMNKHVKRRHLSRRKNDNKEKPPKPSFASVLAGLEKGSIKDLNPQLLCAKSEVDTELSKNNSNSSNMFSKTWNIDLFNTNRENSYVLINEKFENTSSLFIEEVM